MEKVKLFVLDTNVLMYDPSCLRRFKEHDIYIPMVVLEELDAKKTGNLDLARNCRQFSRMLDEIIHQQKNIENGVDLGLGLGKLFLQRTNFKDYVLPIETPTYKADNEILRIVMALKKEETNKDREVILVTKDINLRIKAAALNIEAQDYFNDYAIDDADLLPTGMHEWEEAIWSSLNVLETTVKNSGASILTVQAGDIELLKGIEVNHFIKIGDVSYRMLEKDECFFKLQEVRSEKKTAWGVTPKSIEQQYVFNLLMDPKISLVSILGQAGSGKTFLTLASALEQVLNTKIYDEIIFTRLTIPLGEDIGFLPGNEEEKMSPWLGALEDNLEVLLSMPGSGPWAKGASSDLIKSKIKMKSINFMRGRTFNKKLIVIDEAQNLTQKQIKALITRAGENTKIICLGNLAQIDTPYLTESNNGLSFLVEKFKGFDGYGHVTLPKVVRSRLAEFAAGVL